MPRRARLFILFKGMMSSETFSCCCVWACSGSSRDLGLEYKQVFSTEAQNKIKLRKLNMHKQMQMFESIHVSWTMFDHLEFSAHLLVILTFATKYKMSYVCGSLSRPLDSCLNHLYLHVLSPSYKNQPTGLCSGRSWFSLIVIN